jgi:uncharacterized membrane protein
MGVAMLSRRSRVPRVIRTTWRQIRLRPRLTIAILVGIAAALALGGRLSGPTRTLVAWDAGTGLYLVLAGIMMARATVERMRHRARLEDEGAAAVLGLAVVAATASLAAIVLELVGVKNYPPRAQTLHLALAGATILCSWFFVHTAFALHYAHEFYVGRGENGSAVLEFPGGGPPDYSDFLYFSFVIGTTSQTADVSICSRRMRRLALLHGVITFFFNTTLLAMTVNVAAGLT